MNAKQWQGAWNKAKELICSCPRCGYQHPDHDGLGVLHCEACGWCEHAALSKDDQGLMRCDFCGEEVSA